MYLAGRFWAETGEMPAGEMGKDLSWLIRRLGVA